MMTFPLSHKTVFVFDHSPNFAEPCGQAIDVDVFTKSRPPGMIPLAAISKSLWTSSIEAALEYSRVVFDLFPFRKLIRFIASDTEAHSLNTWAIKDQNYSQLLQALAELGPPPAASPDLEDDCSILHGLDSAIQVLCECTEKQHQVRTSLTESAQRIVNRGRIICITTLKSDEHASMLEECVRDAITQHNKVAAGSDNLMTVNQCELILIHTLPVDEEDFESNITQKSHKVSPLLKSHIFPVRAGRHLAAKLSHLVQLHYVLAVTIINGIPMKEEQNASSSANYDVEIFHDLAARNPDVLLSKDGNLTEEGKAIDNSRVTLKWSTPRAGNAEMQWCTGAYRITPVDVNSRPSTCLTNFLLNGRQVMLEQPKKLGSSSKHITHMLNSHGGEIYLHIIGTSRSTLEDPPSISEGVGGRVTDYRIQDFGQFMRETKLAPFPQATIENANEEEKDQDSSTLPIERAKLQLERMTRHFPLVISGTIIFNMQSHIDPLQSLITKENLDEEEVLECKKSIYHLVGMETRSEPLFFAQGSRGKGPKRDEQYRQMWSELEVLIRACSDLSAAHQEVLECLLQCWRQEDMGGRTPKSPKHRANTPTNQLEMGNGEGRGGGPGSSSSSSSGHNSTISSVGSQNLQQQDKERRAFEKLETNTDHFKQHLEPFKKKTRVENSSFSKGDQNLSLLNLWTSRKKAVNSKQHVEFAGRLDSSNGKATLYPELHKDQNTNG